MSSERKRWINSLVYVSIIDLFYGSLIDWKRFFQRTCQCCSIIASELLIFKILRRPSVHVLDSKNVAVFSWRQRKTSSFSLFKMKGENIEGGLLNRCSINSRLLVSGDDSLTNCHIRIGSLFFRFCQIKQTWPSTDLFPTRFLIGRKRFHVYFCFLCLLD